MIAGKTLYTAYGASLLAALLLQLVELPDALAGARPMWLPLVIAYWALTEPRVSALVGAFLLGVVADVLFGSVLGEHALALVVLAYLVTRLRVIFALFPLWQATLALIPGWVVYAFMLFWIDGATHHQANPWLRWLPIVSTSLFWPLIYVTLEIMLGRREEEE
ncbi:MAG TPA: rod shape-determining protein MreD [Nevskiaceae bacterium]|nr:rod shape-determining protein MreD [Nevskiaceae bacterium]